MVNAIVLLKVDPERVNQVAEAMVELDGVSEVYSVAGQYDLVGVLRASDDDQIASVVTDHMLKIDGIKGSETLIAFRAFSKHDLERMFSVGME
jgi:DNA-binding Lrp family transcriptional regulator